MKMASTGHCEECARLAVSYLDKVRDHAGLMEKRAQMDQDSEAARDSNWQIEQLERRIHEAHKAFLTHRAMHPST
jgi:hypothetical protein